MVERSMEGRVSVFFVEGGEEAERDFFFVGAELVEGGAGPSGWDVEVVLGDGCVAEPGGYGAVLLESDDVGFNQVFRFAGIMVVKADQSVLVVHTSTMGSPSHLPPCSKYLSLFSNVLQGTMSSRYHSSWVRAKMRNVVAMSRSSSWSARRD